MATDDIKEDYSFSVLHEQVADEDLFEDKPHEKVSETLHKVMENTDKGLTIGLEGSWGSGKSTVINLLKDKLEKDSEKRTLFFMFDAWAHDGDPLRKIFLESLILAMDKDDTDPVLSKLKSEVSARTKRVDVTTKKTASRLGKLLSASALVIPVGAALLSAVNYEKVTAPWNGFLNGPAWLLWLGLLFALAPMLVITWWYFFGDTEKGKRVWDIFEAKSNENYTQDITEDGERTSIEFERYFAEILDYALGQDSSRYDRAVIVIDNLDRVEPEHAKNIWSTLQTFFQHRASASDIHRSWGDRLWFIVPFDRVGLSKIWEVSTNDNDSDKKQDGLASSFLGKCFQLTAAVPEPVMSAWADYLEGCIAKSLTGWPEREKEEVSETYQRFVSNLEQSPTPREIRLTVNQIGMFGLAWGGIVSAEAICFFAILRQRQTDRELRASLLKQGLPDNYQSRITETDLKSELAGLLFGVSKDKGLQLLLAPEIHTALRNSDSEYLQELVEKHDRAFWIVWQAKKSEWLPTDNHADDYKIAFTSAVYKGLSDYIHRLNYDIEQLEKAWKDSSDNWRIDRYDYVKPMSEILNLSTNRTGFLNWLQQTITKKLASLIKQVGTEKFNSDELSNLNKLVLFLKQQKQPLKVSSYENLNLENWKEWLDAIEYQELKFDMVLPTKGTIEQIAAEANFNQNTLNTEAISYLRQTLDVYPKSGEWGPVAEKVISWANLTGREINCEPLYDLYLNLIATQNNSIASKLKKSVSEAAFWQRGSLSPIEENISLPILAAIACADELQSLSYVSSEVKTLWSSEHDDETPQKVFNSLKALRELQTLWILARDKQNLLAAQIIRLNLGPELFSLAEGTMYLDEYDWLEDSEIAEFAKLLCQHGSFENSIEDISGNASTYHKVFSIFNLYGDDKARTFINLEVNNITTEDWIKHLDACNGLLRCINTKNHKFSDAFTNFLINTVSGKVTPKDWIWNNFNDLLSKTVDTEVVVLPKIAEAYFKSEKDYLSRIAFDVLTPEISKHMLSIQPINYMERLNIWIDENNQDRILWLIEQKLQKPEAPLESLTERVKSALNSEEISEKDIFEQLNRKLELGIVSQSENTTSEDETEERE